MQRYADSSRSSGRFHNNQRPGGVNSKRAGDSSNSNPPPSRKASEWWDDAGDSFVDATIVSASYVIATGRWRYGCSPIVTDPTGDAEDANGGWMLKDGATSLPYCYNRAELVIASITGATPADLHGTGFPFAQITSGYAIQPMPVGTPVLLRPRGDGSYWFGRANALAGGCG